jgi:hypothetical protein
MSDVARWPVSRGPSLSPCVQHKDCKKNIYWLFTAGPIKLPGAAHGTAKVDRTRHFQELDGQIGGAPS